jgi:hypothetical protein
MSSWPAGGEAPFTWNCAIRFVSQTEASERIICESVRTVDMVTGRPRLAVHGNESMEQLGQLLQWRQTCCSSTVHYMQTLQTPLVSTLTTGVIAENRFNRM